MGRRFCSENKTAPLPLINLGKLRSWTSIAWPALACAMILTGAALISSCSMYMAAAPSGGGFTLTQFPWPPPAGSVRTSVPDEFFTNSKSSDTTLGDADRKLNHLLQVGGYGYGAGSYFLVPGGYARVMNMEQTHEDGTPLPGTERWQTPLRVASWDHMFTGAPSAYYQVLVFVVTSKDFVPTGSLPASSDAKSWAQMGLNHLPLSAADTAWTRTTHCTVLVYDFVKPPAGEPDGDKAVLIPGGRMRAEDHLIRVALWQPMHKGGEQ